MRTVLKSLRIGSSNWLLC